MSCVHICLEEDAINRLFPNVHAINKKLELLWMYVLSQEIRDSVSVQ